MSELSRRAVLSTGGRAAVATLSLGSLAVAAPSLAGDDPIFAAIEAHRAAEIRFHEALEHLSGIEGEFMERVSDWQERMAAEQADPRYCEADRAREAASDASESAAIALLDIYPTSLAGVIAMLEYVDEYQVHGRTFPDSLVDEDDESENPHTRPFEAFLSRTLASALRAMASPHIAEGAADA